MLIILIILLLILDCNQLSSGNLDLILKKVLSSRTNDKICKGTLNHVAKWSIFAKWLSDLLRTKWLWVRFRL